MNERIKREWIAALRSGEYKQGKGQLHDPKRNEYCCLGVLCELYAKETGEGYDPQRPFLPTPVVEWAGLAEEDPYVTVDDRFKRNKYLASQNDEGVTFQQIAMWIEKGVFPNGTDSDL